MGCQTEKIKLCSSPLATSLSSGQLQGGDQAEKLLGTEHIASRGGRGGRGSRADVGGGGGGGVTAAQIVLAGVAAGILFYLLSGLGALARGVGPTTYNGNWGDGGALLAAGVSDLAAQLKSLADAQHRGFADLNTQLRELRGGDGAGGASVTSLAGGSGAGGATAKVVSLGIVGRQPGIHVVVTSNGNRYMNWQTRVLYANYRRAASASPALRGFTRVLHRTSDDELMQEVPTRRFAPLQPDCDVWCQYPVADRSQALLEWLSTPDSKQFEHIMIIETAGNGGAWLSSVPSHDSPLLQNR